MDHVLLLFQDQILSTLLQWLVLLKMQVLVLKNSGDFCERLDVQRKALTVENEVLQRIPYPFAPYAALPPGQIKTP